MKESPVTIGSSIWSGRRGGRAFGSLLRRREEGRKGGREEGRKGNGEGSINHSKGGRWGNDVASRARIEYEF